MQRDGGVRADDGLGNLPPFKAFPRLAARTVRWRQASDPDTVDKQPGAACAARVRSDEGVRPTDLYASLAPDDGDQFDNVSSSGYSETGTGAGARSRSRSDMVRSPEPWAGSTKSSEDGDSGYHSASASCFSIPSMSRASSLTSSATYQTDTVLTTPLAGDLDVEWGLGELFAMDEALAGSDVLSNEVTSMEQSDAGSNCSDWQNQAVTQPECYGSLDTVRGIETAMAVERIIPVTLMHPQDLMSSTSRKSPESLGSSRGARIVNDTNVSRENISDTGAHFALSMLLLDNGDELNQAQRSREGTDANVVSKRDQPGLPYSSSRSRHLALTEPALNSSMQHYAADYCRLCSQNLNLLHRPTALLHFEIHLKELAAGVRWRCFDCDFDLLHEADLTYHLRCAEYRSCGFNFDHLAACTGHHKPGTHDPDQQSFQSEVANWELSQLRSHRSQVEELGRKHGHPSAPREDSIARVQLSKSCPANFTESRRQTMSPPKNLTRSRYPRRQRSCPQFKSWQSLHSSVMNTANEMVDGNQSCRAGSETQSGLGDNDLEYEPSLPAINAAGSEHCKQGSWNSDKTEQSSPSQNPIKLISSPNIDDHRNLERRREATAACPGGSICCSKMQSRSGPVDLSKACRHIERGNCRVLASSAMDTTTLARPMKRRRLSKPSEIHDSGIALLRGKKKSQIKVWLDSQENGQMEEENLTHSPKSIFTSPRRHSIAPGAPSLGLARVFSQEQLFACQICAAETATLSDFSTVWLGDVYQDLRADSTLSFERIESAIHQAIQYNSIAVDMEDLKYWCRSCDEDASEDVSFETFQEILKSVLTGILEKQDCRSPGSEDSVDDIWPHDELDSIAPSDAVGTESNVIATDSSAFTSFGTSDATQPSSTSGFAFSNSGFGGSGGSSGSSGSSQKRGPPNDSSPSQDIAGRTKRGRWVPAKQIEQLTCTEQDCPGKDESIAELL